MEGTRGGDASGRAAAYGDRHGDWPRDDHPYHPHHSTSRHARREGSEQAADIYAQPLKAYSQWLELQDGAVSAHEAARQYEEYKSTYMHKLAFGFFTTHKDDAWFHDKYHPEALDKRHQAITALAQQNYVAFAADHELGKLDWDSITQASLHPLDDGRGAKPSPPGGEEAEERTAEQVPEDAARGSSEEGEPGRGGAKVGQANAREESCCDIVFDHLLDAKQLNATVHREVEPPRDSLYIKHIPAQGSREELHALFEQVEGFVELVISEPRRFQDFHRTGWAVYESADACQRAHHKFNGYRLRDYDLQLGLPSGSGAERRRKRVRVAPLVADEEARLEKDADTAAQLVRILDRERAIDSDALLALAGSKQEEQEMVVEEAGDARAAVRTRLHRSIEYLRRVHLFCYYCAEQFESRAELHRVCGDLPHRRSTLFPGTPSPAREAVPPEEVSWLAYLDARLEQRLSAPAPELCTAKLAVEQEVDAFLEAHVKREDEKKYRCAVPKCTKLFMAPDFVRKHLKLKHPHLVEEATRKAVEEQYFQNYVRDPRRILPSMPEATLSARPEQQLQQQRGGGAGRAAVAVGAYSSGAGVMGDAPAGMSALSSHSPRHRDTASPLYAREPVGYAPAFPRSRGFGGGRGGGGGGGGRFGGHHRPGYVDLDAPPEDASLGEQRTTIDYGDLDAVPEPPPSITSRLIPASATALDD